MKQNVDDLAIFGGQPEFTEPLHVGGPNVGDRTRLLERIEAVLNSRWLTNNGQYVRELEERIKQLTGTRHCVAMCNGTIALQIVARAMELKGEVILPSFTFVATAHAFQWLGIRPVFCDVDERTRTIDPERIEELITPHTAAIVGVHLWGRPCEIDALADIARRNGIRLLFDAAHAFGCTHQGTAIGGFGDAEVFSFHATKFVNSFEGGAVTTNDEDLAGRLQAMRNFGFVDYDRVEGPGINAKMNEVCAAMGLTSLESMDNFIAVNRRNYEQYRFELDGIPGLNLLTYDERERCNYQYVVIDFDGSLSLSRDEICNVLWAENILVRRYFYPGCHRMEPYSLTPEAHRRMSVTEALVARLMSVPTGTTIAADTVAEICTLIRLILGNADEVRTRLTKLRR